MRRGIKRVVQTGVLLSLFGLGGAEAQFSRFPGLLRLPDNDFTWNWGDTIDSRRAGIEDFSIRGSQDQFRCTLTGRLRPSSRYTSAEIRDLENQLRSSILFVEDAAYAMSDLDQQREIQWATLACTKPEPTAVDEQRSQEREERAREKALRDLQRRREKREREEQDDE